MTDETKPELVQPYLLDEVDEPEEPTAPDELQTRPGGLDEVDEPNEPTGERLDWESFDDESRAAVGAYEVDGEACYWSVCLQGDAWWLLDSDDELIAALGDDDLGPYDTIDAAMAAAEDFNRAILTQIRHDAAMAAEVVKADPPAADALITNNQAELIFRHNKRIRQAYIDEADAAEEHKARKAERKECEAKLRVLLNEIEAGPGPLYGTPANGDGDDPAEDPDAETDMGAEAETDADGPDGWRHQLLAELPTSGIRDRTLAILAEHEPAIVTVGDLTDWQNAKAGFWAADIKGIGPSAQQRIEDALEEFWLARQEAHGEAIPTDLSDEALAKLEAPVAGAHG